MTLPVPDNFLDERNQSLWEELNKTYTISLENGKESNWVVYTQGQNVIIYAPIGSTSKDSFTHELLHIYLKQKGILAGNQIILLVSVTPELRSVLSRRLLEHIGNAMDHAKILPIYLQMGFERTKFIEDYSLPKCSPQELKGIYAAMGVPAFRNEAIDFFIGKFFDMKACPNDTIDHTPLLKQLESIDPILFEVLNNFWTEWSNFNIEKIDPIFNDYRGFCTDFVSGLEDRIKTINS